MDRHTSMLKQKRDSLNPQTHFARIPIETLCQIFDEAVQSMIQCVRISHVCRLWRAVTLDRKHLWQSIDLDARYQITQDQIIELAKRSGNLRLNITVIWRGVGELEEPRELPPIIDRSFASRISTLVLDARHAYFQPLETIASLSTCAEFMDLDRLEIYNTKSLVSEICLNKWMQSTRDLAVTYGLGPCVGMTLPRLEYLYLGDIPWQRFSSAIRMFQECAPNLRNLHLQFISFPREELFFELSIGRLASQLVSLCVEDCTWVALVVLCRSNELVHLSNLSVSCLGDLEVDDEDVAYMALPYALKKLVRAAEPLNLTNRWDLILWPL